MRLSFIAVLLTTAVCLIAGCSTSLPTFTASLRSTLSAGELSSLSFFLSTDMEFRSTQKGVMEGEGLMRVERRKTWKIESVKPGRAVQSGEGWIVIDFGDGLLITFRQSDRDGTYLCPAWGTYTFNGERFDATMGALAGGYVELQYSTSQIKN